MKHLAAYLLLQLGGNETPSKEEITAALATVGVLVDDERLDKLLADLEGKNVADVMAEGKLLLAKFGGGGGGGGGGGSAAAAPEEAAAVVEEKEEEVEMDLGGGMDMFGGDEGGGGGGDY